MKIYQATSVVWLTALVATLTACGGGGSDATNTTITTPVVTAPITTPVVTAPITTPVTGPITTAALTLEVEPNNGSVANPLTPSVPLTGQLSSATDQDWYAVTAASAGTISIDFMTVGAPMAGWKYSIIDSASNILSSVTCIGGESCSKPIAGISAAGTYYIVVEMGTSRYAVNTSNYVILATTTTSNAAVEIEKNNASIAATPIISGMPLTGQLSSASDQDWYAVKAASAGSISIDFMTVGAPMAGWKYSIIDSQSNILSSVTCIGGESCSKPRAGIPAAGTYYIVVVMGTERYAVNTSNYILTYSF